MDTNNIWVLQQDVEVNYIRFSIITLIVCPTQIQELAAVNKTDNACLHQN